MNINDIQIGKQYLYSTGGVDKNRDNSIVTADYHNGTVVRIKFSDSLGIDVNPTLIHELGSYVPVEPETTPLDDTVYMPEVRIDPPNTSAPVMPTREPQWSEIDPDVLDWLISVSQNLNSALCLQTDKGLYELPNHIPVLFNEEESGYRLSYDGDADKYVVMVKQ